MKPPESPQQRFERLLSWARDEVKVRGWRGATSRVAKREGVSRTAIEDIFKRHADGKKFLSERSQHVGIRKNFLKS
ncbi:MAG: hypothetical protein HQL97_09150 [Magnetococcales bacterium]|nr:hypothetical protein [Magnetococcales bacterium]